MNNTSIEDYIEHNFQNTTKEEIKESIEDSISQEDEVVLPGLGVFFSILWNDGDDACKDKMLTMLHDHFANDENITPSK
jgi:small acid-soluble spore protein I (minor)